jgi:hypothetical protein
LLHLIGHGKPVQVPKVRQELGVCQVMMGAPLALQEERTIAAVRKQRRTRTAERRVLQVAPVLDTAGTLRDRQPTAD